GFVSKCLFNIKTHF
ncbi:hypothetical protein D049_1691B, partial [Vibrio parahaemolyticus VPTS-2010]